MSGLRSRKVRSERGEEVESPPDGVVEPDICWPDDKFDGLRRETSKNNRQDGKTGVRCGMRCPLRPR